MLHGSSLAFRQVFSLFCFHKIQSDVNNNKYMFYFSFFFCISLSRSKEEIFVALSLYRILQ